MDSAALRRGPELQIPAGYVADLRGTKRTLRQSIRPDISKHITKIASSAMEWQKPRRWGFSYPAEGYASYRHKQTHTHTLYMYVCLYFGTGTSVIVVLFLGTPYAHAIGDKPESYSEG